MCHFPASPTFTSFKNYVLQKSDTRLSETLNRFGHDGEQKITRAQSPNPVIKPGVRSSCLVTEKSNFPLVGYIKALMVHLTTT